MTTTSAVPIHSAPSVTDPAPPPATSAAPVGSTRATVAFAAVAMLVSYLPFSAVNGVLGTIGRTTGTSTGALQWVTDSFTVALTGAVLSGGALAERYGRRRVTVAGLTATAASSVIGWLAGGVGGSGAVHVLWAGQAVAGIGAGLVMSATLSLIAVTAPSPAARTRSIAVWAAANVVGLGSGPFLSGVIADATSWRWLFPPVAVLAALAAVASRWAREATSPAAGRLDLAGQALGTLGVVALVYGVIRGGADGWSTPGAVVGLAAGCVVLAAFLLRERRSAHPVLDPALFRSRGFTAAGVAAATVLFTVIGVVFVFSLLLAAQGVSNLGIAVRIGCLFAGNAIASVAAGPLQARFGSRAVLVTGLVVALGGLATVLGLGADDGFLALAWRLAVVGIGCGTVVATGTAVAVQSVPGPLAGMAGTANNVIRQLGGALGTAVIGGVLADRLAAGAGFPEALHACVVVLVAVLGVATVLTAALLSTRSAPSA